MGLALGVRSGAETVHRSCSRLWQAEARGAALARLRSNAGLVSRALGAACVLRNQKEAIKCGFVGKHYIFLSSSVM